MLSTITILTSFLFAVLYPLCFWVSADKPLEHKLHHFHLGLANFVGGASVVFMWFMPLPLGLKVGATVWKLLFFKVSHYYWRKPYARVGALTGVVVGGIIVFLALFNVLVGGSLFEICMVLLAGLILVSGAFAMNLGHGYLNVHGLPLVYLKRASVVLWILVALRALINGVQLVTSQVAYDGELIRLGVFLSTLDGMLLLVPLCFGTLFPAVACYFVLGTLRCKNTQSATGILYVILCAILLGDLGYKYYWIKFGIFL